PIWCRQGCEERGDRVDQPPIVLDILVLADAATAAGSSVAARSTGASGFVIPSSLRNAAATNCRNVTAARDRGEALRRDGGRRSGPADVARDVIRGVRQPRTESADDRRELLVEVLPGRVETGQALARRRGLARERDEVDG